MSSTATWRVPLGPTTLATVPAATMAGTLSAAGEALHRLPAKVARPCTWVEPIRSIPSTIPGHTLLRLACSVISAPGTAAPMVKPASLSVMFWHSAMRLISTSRSGSIMSACRRTNKSVPPAKRRASPSQASNAATASAQVVGARYCIVIDLLALRKPPL